ncbi:hypothetical protein LIER_27012 [Lithospermum erythrorhizon]|uniref:RNase H type-1 domain-containing protein n=1 Tax=Lithospermum erythrorhizon TaxID=34254 RepID=A0AAV3RC04_LITER
MLGVDPNIALHCLHVDPSFRPIKQKKRNFSDETNLAIQEVTNLMKSHTISMGYEVFDFLDVSRGYHQILLHEDDQEKTMFITKYGLDYWKAMPFSLKNAGATYQRMVNSIFKEQIGRNMEIYVDGMLIKRKVRHDQLRDRSLPFFKKIRQASSEPFEWNEKGTKAKEYLGSLKLLTRKDEGEDLQLYLAVSEGAVSSVLGPRETEAQEVPQWKLYVDGASNEKGLGAGILIKGPKGEVFEYALLFSFKATNNEVEYEAMVTGLEIAYALKIRRLLVQGDSKLVIE